MLNSLKANTREDLNPMDMKIERLDHLPVIAGTLQEIGLIEKIDARIKPHEDEVVTTGQAIAALIICGMGFLQKPLSLTPQFFENHPVGFLLGNESLKAKHFNHFKLGRELENLHKYGIEQLFAELSLEICTEQGFDRTSAHTDTTSFSFQGQYETEAEDAAIEITYGYSKDHRPDLKQMVLEMAVSNEGIPLLCAPWSGNANDSHIFHERLKKLKQSLDSPPLIIWDSKGYSQRNKEWFHHLNFVSRVPGTYRAHNELIKQAIDDANWTVLDETEQKYWQEFKQQDERWIVVHSRASRERSEKNLEKQIPKEKASLTNKLKALKRKSFACEADARQAAEDIFSKAKYHTISCIEVESKEKHSGPGRPKKDSTKTLDHWRVNDADNNKDEHKILFLSEEEACYIVVTNHPDMAAGDVVKIYSEQSKVERGFRFLKDPQFFTSSMFLKKPERVQGLLMVMTLALMVYSIAERKLRQSLAANNETLPNQIKQETATPTLRWVFQMLSGIHRVHLEIPGQEKQCLMEGLDEVKTKAIKQLGGFVCKYYQIEGEVPCSM